MSYLEKMYVQGIRSFGPDDRDAQVIEFKPLTLILGPNGSGKTTLIECLRYITTGDMPPNSGKGSSFVHDPKIAMETEVKGQVRLRFRDINGKPTTAIRSLVATQKQKNVSIRTLDSVIKRIGPGGEPISLTSKCADIDKEMVRFLGVSKSVLTNVIFCHQEDSNWPLSEGKALKERFDEIFDASRYIKALETIKKLRQKKMEDKKLLDNDLHHLEKNKEKANQIKNELKGTESRFHATNDKVKEIEASLKPLEDELNGIMQREAEIFEVEKEMEKKKSVMKEKQRERDRVERSIKTLFDGSKEELEDKIANFRTESQNNATKLRKAQEECSNIDRIIRQRNEKKFGLQKEISKLETFEEQHHQKVKERNDKLRSLVHACKLNIDAGSDNVDEALVAIIQEVNKELNEEQEKREKFREEEMELQKKIDSLKMENSKTEQAIKMHRETMAKYEKECQSLNDKIKRAESSSNTIYELDTNIVCLESELDSISNITNIDVLQSENEKLKTSKAVLENEIKDLSTELDCLQRDSVIHAELGMQEKQKREKEETMQKVVRRHSDLLKQLLGSVPSESMQEKLNRYLNQCEGQISELRSKQQRQRSNLATLQTSTDMENRQLKSKEEDLNSYREQIMKACGTQDYEECIAKLQTTVNELLDDKGALTGSRYLFTKYVEKVREDECCPLCHRGFKDKSESEELISDLKQQLDMLPLKLKQKERVLNEKQKKLHALLELKPILKNIKQLEEEIPGLKTKLESNRTEINQIRAELGELQESLDANQLNLQSAQSVQRDAILYDQARSDVRQLDTKINALKSNLKTTAQSKPIDVVRKELNAKQEKLKSIGNKIDENHRKVNKYYGDVQKLKEQINDLKKEKLDLATEMQQQATFEERLSKLTKEKQEVELAIQKAQSELAEKKRDVENIEKEKTHLVKTHEQELKILKERVSSLAERLKVVKNLSSEIKSYIQGGNTARLEKCQQDMKKLQEELTTHQSKKDVLEKECQRLQKEVSNQKMLERELQDNLQLYECRSQIARLEEEIERLKNRLGTVRVHDFRTRKQELQRSVEKLNGERQQLKGRRQELEQQVDRLKADLKDGIYKDADQKYMNAFIDCHTTGVLIEDLKKYYEALDHSVMAYHSKKMNEINTIIHDLWQNSYSGSDIDYIEIRSDDQGSSLEKRRNYNYRVVMVTGETALDMRGRCSAGQKVLASIIIRLALAEAFCINCGVLTLDEPTTNLDRAHIDNLAASLKEIVRSRSQQKNFQLVVITHDEDFIEMLAADSDVEHVLMIKKNNENLSRITKSEFKKR